MLLSRWIYSDGARFAISQVLARARRDMYGLLALARSGRVGAVERQMFSIEYL